MNRLCTALLLAILPLVVLLVSYSAFNEEEPPHFETFIEIVETFPKLENTTNSVANLRNALQSFPSANNTQGMNALEVIGMFFTSLWRVITGLFGFLIGLLNDFLLLMSWTFSLFSYL